MSVETPPEPLRLPVEVMPLARLAGELAEDVERLARHVPHLDQAAVDEDFHPNVRFVAAAQARACRAVLTMLGVEV